MLLNRGWISQTGGEHRVRSRAFWDRPRLGVEHMVGSDGRVSLILEIVEGRLEMTRTIRFTGQRVTSIVLVYVREGTLALKDGRQVMAKVDHVMRSPI